MTEQKDLVPKETVKTALEGVNAQKFSEIEAREIAFDQIDDDFIIPFKTGQIRRKLVNKSAVQKTPPEFSDEALME